MEYVIALLVLAAIVAFIVNRRRNKDNADYGIENGGNYRRSNPRDENGPRSPQP